MKTFILLIILLNVIIINSHKCGIHLLNNPKRILHYTLSSSSSSIDFTKWSPIRIHFDYSNFNTDNKELLSFLKNTINPIIIKTFSSIIKVHPFTSPLTIDACGPIKLPFPVKVNNTDIIIFVTTDESFIENDVEAAAIHCVQDSITHRPIAGYIKYSPDLIFNSTRKADIAYFTWLTLHEITHVLVMNKDLYPDFIDSNTNLPLGIENIITKQRMSPNNKQRYSFFTTKNVMIKAKKHFGCDDIVGVPLENKGGAGTSLSHWSKLYMNTDYMIGDSYLENNISEITLALFEDSGWYRVDYNKSDIFLWGKGKGCDFFGLKCIRNMKTLFKEEFCTKRNEEMCTIGRKAKGICSMEKKGKEYKGIDELMNYCPIPVGYDNEEEYYENTCRYGVKRFNYEYIGENSACFNTISNQKKVPLCLEYKCDKDKKVYSIKIDNKEYECSKKQEEIIINSVIVHCNSYNMICPNNFYLSTNL